MAKKVARAKVKAAPRKVRAKLAPHKVALKRLVAAHDGGGTKLPRRPVRLLEEVRMGELDQGDDGAGEGGGGDGGPTRRACSLCRQPGHKAPTCPSRASGSSPSSEGPKAEVVPAAVAVARRKAEPPRLQLIRARAAELKQRQLDRAALDAEISRLARQLPPEREVEPLEEEVPAKPPGPFVDAALVPPEPYELPELSPLRVRWKRQGARRRLPTESLIKLRSLIRMPADQQERRQLRAALELHAVTPRPTVWGDCRPAGVYWVDGHPERQDEDGPLRFWQGACPWASCKWNLGASVNETGSITWLGGLDDGLPTCVLELAGKHGPLTLERVGELDGITRERIRQIEDRALRKSALAPVLLEGQD